MATVLIIGASQGIGLETVRRGLAAGYDIRAFARSAHRIGIEHDKLERISASALDDAAIEKAVEGCQAVITTLGTPPTLSRVTLFSQSIRHTVTAMEGHGVKRLIAVTGIGAGDSRGVGGAFYTKIVQPLVLRTMYEDKDREERIIMKSGVDWTIVRPGYLTRLRATGKYDVLTERRTLRGGFISRSDVAEFLIRQINDDTYLGATPLLVSSR